MAPKVNPEDINLVFYGNNMLRKPTSTRLMYLREQVERLIKIPQPEQRSDAWYTLRDSMLTASDWGTILGMNPYSNSNQLLLKKSGKDMPFLTNPAIEWGVKYEDVAVQIYEQRNQVEILLFGCIRHPTINFLGASPDGISKDGIMLEIKCPSKRQITGVIPPYYWCQVQAQLEVCELDRCDFLECNIKEYISKEDYLNDNFEENYTKNNLGMEKGCVLEFYNKKLKKNNFCYSPIGIIGEELEKWITYTKNSYLLEHEECIFYCESYWTLREISCIPIYRNQEWFNEAYYKLEAFWKEILEWRKIGYKKLEEKIEEEKRLKKAQKEEKKQSSNKKKKTENIYLDLNDFIIDKNKPVQETDVTMDEDEQYNTSINTGKSLFSSKLNYIPGNNSSLNNQTSINSSGKSLFSK